MVLNVHKSSRKLIKGTVAMRHQFVLDKKSKRQLDELAESHGGNRSRVVREAIALYADQEEYLEKIESDPKFIEMMEKSAADIKAGRVSEQAEVERRFAKKRKRN
jgi:predicted transcriptional regulator